MVIEVIMPKLGQTMEEGKIVKWLKKEGERVERGEPILEVETDKATLEVEARGSGILRKILHREGEVVPITTVIGYIAEEGEPLPEESQEAVSKPKPSSVAERIEERVEETPKIRPTSKKVKASPLAKRIAEEKGVDLTQITGTGPGGRITKDDVISFLSSKLTAPAVATTPVPPAPEEEFQVVPVSGMRLAIARKMTYSKTSIPHFYISTEVDMTEAVKMRKALIPTVEAKAGVRLSFTHLLIKAVAIALEEFPQLNAVYEEDKIKIMKNINIGIAVGLEDGLIVPVLKGANKMNLAQIASKADDIIARAREKRLREDEFVGGTFTISNLGTFDVDSFIAIINPPETAILAVGRIKEKPAVVDGKITIRNNMNATLSADHRTLDGATAARFLQKIKMLLETPHNLLI